MGGMSVTPPPPPADTPDSPTPLVSNVKDVALIFEGGGMRGALTSATVVTLLEAGIYFDWVAGISAGASNVCNYISRDTWRARECFVGFAADPNFGNLRTWLRGKGMFNAEYIYQDATRDDGPIPIDWGTFIRNPAQSRIVSFRADDGQQVVWTQEDFTTHEALALYARASSTMPVVMPPTVIDGETYVDGALGVSGGIALDVALAEGFTKFVAVLSQPRGYVRAPVGHDRFYRWHFRRFPAVAEAIRTRHERYNATRERIFELERAGQAMVFVPEEMPISNGERDLAKLGAAHELGLKQARRELPALREFLDA